MSGIHLLLAATGAGAGVFGATATPDRLNSGGSAGTHTTATVTAIASGGSGSYTYAWTIHVAPATGAGFTINSDATAATTVDITSISAGEAVTGTIRCTITDTSTLEEATVDVAIRHIDSRTP